MHILTKENGIQGRIQDSKLGGGHLKKFSRAEGGAKSFGVFRVKNHDFTPKKNHIFSNFRGDARRVRPPLDPPLVLNVDDVSGVTVGLLASSAVGCDLRRSPI